MPTLCSFLDHCTALLHKHAVDSPRLCAQILLAFAMGTTRQDLLKQLVLSPETPLSAQAQAQTSELVAIRATGKPIAYIVGYKEFYGRSFLVTEDTLIPRPETERIIEIASAFAATRAAAGKQVTFADFGTGSGCIAVSLALEIPSSQGIALDLCPKALHVAAKNAANLEAPSLQCICADFTLPLLQSASLDILVSNPPYISDAEYRSISWEVRDFEPKTALVSGSNGLNHPGRVIREAARYLKPHGLLLVEMGSTQGEAYKEIMSQSAELWQDISVLKDLAGHDRVLYACRSHRQAEPA